MISISVCCWCKLVKFRQKQEVVGSSKVVFINLWYGAMLLICLISSSNSSEDF